MKIFQNKIKNKLKKEILKIREIFKEKEFPFLRIYAHNFLRIKQTIFLF